jgi:ATP-dependent Zn protease
MCGKVHLSLAGRVAEELRFGASLISSGSRSDLISATELASEAFAFWGFAPGMEDDAFAGSNLAIIDPETITPSEYAHVEKLVREFLAEEYGHVKETLTTYHRLLESVAEELLKREVLDRDAILALMQADMKGRAIQREA